MSRLPDEVRWRPAKRSSFARRDSNLALIGAMLSGVVLAIALILLLVSKVNPEQGRLLRGAAADVLQPVHAIVSAPFRFFGAVGGAVANYWRAGSRVGELEADLAEARKQAERARQMEADIARLDALLKAARPERRLVASGMASASPASAATRTAIISVGAHHGVRPRMPVIAADGLAGRVSDVGLGAARIILLTDASSRVPVKVERTGWTGLAVGRGTSRMEFQFDTASGSDLIRVGDRLVTSGDGGLFPPGVPVGVVVDVSTNPPRIRPAANPTGLGMVRVEAPWLPPPDFIPAAPAPAEADRPVPPASTAPATTAPATTAVSSPVGRP